MIGIIGSRDFPFEIFNSKRTNFVAGVEQLISKESLESLIAAKAKGATFGALSDTEMAILRSAATKIAGWRIDKDGNPVLVRKTIDEEGNEIIVCKDGDELK